jgi:ABC-type multidrug transport system fused ATPase/permease subunit
MSTSMETRHGREDNRAAASDRPGRPDPNARFPVLEALRWLMRGRWKHLAIATAVTCLFLGSLQLVPFILGRAIDLGLVAGDHAAFLLWAGALGAVILIVTATGVGSNLLITRENLSANFRAQRSLVETVMEIGSRLRASIAAGEVVAISAADTATFGYFVGNFVRFLASAFALALAVAILSTESSLFALAIGLGMPLLILALRPVFLHLEARISRSRELIGEQTAIAADAVSGLRVLRGVGGERYFTDRYRRASRSARDAGIRVGHALAWLEFARITLPGALTLLLVSVGAAMALGGDISVGQFAALFGYMISLIRPLAFTILFIDDFTRAVVAARRFQHLHRVADLATDVDEAPVWANDEPLHDPATGVTAQPGLITGIVVPDAAEGRALLERLGGYGPTPWARIGDHDLDAFPIDLLRRRILLLEANAQLFSGVLRDQLDVDGTRSDADIMRALHTASAVDVVGLDPSWLERDTVPEDGYDLNLIVGERGRNFSGGERQRLLLARGLLADPEVLILDHPTSACDAQTDARIADRLRSHRAGSTTIVATDSPALLAQCDRVVLVGDAVLEGTHRTLLAASVYREVVNR